MIFIANEEHLAKGFLRMIEKKYVEFASGR